MFNQTIKCDANYHRYGEKEELSLSEAVGAGWYEIEVHPGQVQWRKPKTTDSFHTDSLHVCSRGHLIEICEAEITKQLGVEANVADETEAKPY